MNKTVIIGGGVAGLTAGIYCEKSGIDCEILEKNAFCGGNLTGWFREGCYIDNCFHWLTGTLYGTELYGIWRDIGMITDRRELYQPGVFYESTLDGKSIAFSRYPEVTRLNMLKLSAEDATEINRFIDAAEAVGDFTEKKQPTAALLKAYTLYRGITLRKLSEKFRHPLLKKTLTDYFGEYFSAIALVWAYGTFISGNGMIPKGGSKNAAKRIENRFLELGGRIQTNRAVDRIVTDGHRAYGVITNDGEYIRAGAVICACAPSVTFGRLLTPRNMPRDFAAVYKNNNLAPKFSSVQAAFLCPSEAVLAFGTRVISCNIADTCTRIVIKEYSYERNFSPDGTTAIQAMLFTDSDACEKWISLYSDKERYNSEKRAYAKAMENAIISSFPQAKGRIKCLDVWTPATYHGYFGADYGSYMSFALTPKTPLKRFSCRLKGLENIFLATQWQCSPGGLPNAARAGKSAAETVKKLFKKPII